MVDDGTTFLQMEIHALTPPGSDVEYPTELAEATDAYAGERAIARSRTCCNGRRVFNMVRYDGKSASTRIANCGGYVLKQRVLTSVNERSREDERAATACV